MRCERCSAQIKFGEIYYENIGNAECVCSSCVTEVLEDILSDAERVCESIDMEDVGYAN